MKSDIIYFADQKNFPYGKKSKSQLNMIIMKTINLLEEKFKPDLIVMGSNTPSILVSVNKKNVVKVLPPIKKASKISVTGNVATSALGTATQNTKYLITGVTATGNVGIVLVYTQIVASQTPNWSTVTTNTTSWTNNAPSQTPNWTDIAA